MIPEGRYSYPTVKVCPGGAGILHDWIDHSDHSPGICTRARAFESCPDHDSLPNQVGMEHLQQQYHTDAVNPYAFEKRPR